MADTKKTSINDSAPDVIDNNSIFWPNTGGNPARYLVNPGKVLGPNKHSSGALRHARPYIVSGNVIFVFPLGVEGFQRSGQATLGLHRYIGANSVDAQTIMREEGRITLTGVFPGNTAQDAMVACINILRSSPNEPGLILFAPGVFDMEQYVTAETWEFTHAADDRTHSIEYSIAFVRTGEGRSVADPHGKPSVTQPTVTRKPTWKPSKTFVAKVGAQTLRAISKAVYGDVNDWQRIVTLNANFIGSFNATSSVTVRGKVTNLATWQLPTYRFPVGTKFKV